MSGHVWKHFWLFLAVTTGREVLPASLGDLGMQLHIPSEQDKDPTTKRDRIPDVKSEEAEKP